MISRNISFRNVAELVPFEDGWLMYRLPADLRFCMLSDSATIRLRTLPMEEAQAAHIYYGSLQGGWPDSSRLITTGPTDLVIHRPNNPYFVSQDMVHPSLEGVWQIAERWHDRMQPILREKGIFSG